MNETEEEEVRKVCYPLLYVDAQTTCRAFIKCYLLVVVVVVVAGQDPGQFN